uniref:Uncharacterized protein n=1 Tax=Arundo donax TaxID=35708 RepID=A0A0A9HNQ4_ARUDO
MFCRPVDVGAATAVVALGGSGDCSCVCVASSWGALRFGGRGGCGRLSRWWCVTDLGAGGLLQPGSGLVMVPLWIVRLFTSSSMGLGSWCPGPVRRSWVPRSRWSWRGLRAGHAVGFRS